MAPLPLDLAVIDHRLTPLYYVVAETSFLSFVNLRWSFICHSSQATSPSMLPMAPAVNPVGVAATVALVAGATPVLHEPATTAGAPGNAVAVPGPAPVPLASTAYQNEYRGLPDGVYPINPIADGAYVCGTVSAWNATAEVKIAPRLTLASACFDFAW